MILGQKILEKIYPNFKGDIEPAGIDLRVGKVYEILDSDEVGMYADTKRLPPLKELAKSKKVLPDKNITEGYYLRSGRIYSIMIDRKMDIPEDVLQLYFPRSSLLRCGLNLHTAVGDCGFSGHLQFLIKNDSDTDFFLGDNERFAQTVSFEVKEGSLYDGDYNE